MSFKSLGDILPKHVKKQGIGEQLEATVMLEYFMTKAKELWGSDVEQDMKPMYVKNKTLTVAVTNAPLAQELKLHEAEILEYITKKAGFDAVERLRYLL